MVIFIFPLTNRNELTFWLNITRYLEGGQGTQFSRKKPFFHFSAR
jgi:hypothetical protein